MYVSASQKQHVSHSGLTYMLHEVGDDDGYYQAGGRQRADGSPQPPRSSVPPLLRFWHPCRATACWCSQPRRQHICTRCCVATLIWTCCRIDQLLRSGHIATEGLPHLPHEPMLAGVGPMRSQLRMQVIVFNDFPHSTAAMHELSAQNDQVRLFPRPRPKRRSVLALEAKTT
jgi:hypothetical protein